MANVYSSVEVATMKRSTFNRKVPHKTSLPFGKWIPVGKVQEVLPHDTWRLDAKGIIRMLTPIVPIMDDISFDVVSFFVPYTIMWSKAKQFFGENDQVAWDLVQNIDFPRLKVQCGLVIFNAGDETIVDSSFAKDPYFVIRLNNDGTYDEYYNCFDRSILEYFGLPVHFNQEILTNLYSYCYGNGNSVTASVKFYSNFTLLDIVSLALRADQLIYNNWFRNQNVTDPVKDFAYDDFDKTSSGGSIFKLRNGVRWKDLFTACLPEPQRGPSVGINVGGEAMIFAKSAVSSPSSPLSGTMSPGEKMSVVNLSQITANGLTKSQVRGAATDGTPSGYVDLYADLSTATMATINQIRYAFATQRYYEKLARGGALYRDYIRVMFGVTPADLSIQIPTLLGSKHFHININQVLSTAETLDGQGEVSSPVGSTGAVSATGFADHIFTNSFSQHGLVLSYLCIRKEHTYCQGLDKQWTKTDAFDIYNPTFAHIGEVGVETQEVYYDPTDSGTIKNTDVLGYNEAWYEYRYDRPVVTGLLNPLNPGSGQLSAFTLVDVLETTPTLDDKFIMEDPNGLDRSLVAGAAFTDQFVADLLCDYTCTRVMPVHSTPGLLDHF